jgi:hypothetical protein
MLGATSTVETVRPKANACGFVSSAREFMHYKLIISVQITHYQTELLEEIRHEAVV